MDTSAALPGLQRRPGVLQWSVMTKAGQLCPAWCARGQPLPPAAPHQQFPLGGFMCLAFPWHDTSPSATSVVVDRRLRGVWGGFGVPINHLWQVSCEFPVALHRRGTIVTITQLHGKHSYFTTGRRQSTHLWPGTAISDGQREICGIKNMSTFIQATGPRGRGHKFLCIPYLPAEAQTHEMMMIADGAVF